MFVFFSAPPCCYLPQFVSVHLSLLLLVENAKHVAQFLLVFLVLHFLANDRAKLVEQNVPGACVHVVRKQQRAYSLWEANDCERHAFSGAGTNLKVGGGNRPARNAGKKFFWSCPSTFLAQQVQLVVSVNAFVMVRTVWSVSCLLFFYSRCPPPASCPAFVKVGHVPSVPNGVGATVCVSK